MLCPSKQSERLDCLTLAANAIPFNSKWGNEIFFYQFFSGKEWQDITWLMANSHHVKEFIIAPCCDIRCDLII